MKGKEYIRPVRANWWLRKKSYTLFMVREATALFVSGYALFLLVLLYRASQGPEVFRAFVEGLRSPLSIVLHLLVLAMALYHTITWFSATPKITVFWRGEEKVGAGTVLAVNYVIWIVVSVVVVGIALATAR